MLVTSSSSALSLSLTPEVREDVLRLIHAHRDIDHLVQDIYIWYILI